MTSGPGNRRWRHQFVGLATFGALIVVLAIVNAAAGKLGGRIDITATNLYTFHPNTLELLESIDDIIAVTFYNTGQWPLDLQAEEDRIRDTLEEFQRRAGDKFVVEEINPLQGVTSPEDVTNVLRRMEESGIPVRLYRTGETMGGTKTGFFSLRVECGGQQALITNPDSEEFLEYRMASAINKAWLPRKQVGILTPNVRVGQDEIFPHLPRVINEFATARKIFPIRTDDYRFDPALDALLILMPRNLTPESLQSLDQYIMLGKPVVIAADGLVPMTSQQWVPGSSPLLKMLAHYGVEVQKGIAYELNDGLQLVEDLPAGRGRTLRMPNYYKFRTTRRTMESEHPLIRGLNDVLFLLPSALKISAEKSSDVKATPLIWTTDRAGFDGPVMIPAPDPQRKFDKDKLSTQLLAVELSGTFPSFGNAGPWERADDLELSEPGTGRPRAVPANVGAPVFSKPDTQIVVIGGTWTFSDETNRQGIALIQNIMEQLLFKSNLSAPRSERIVTRTLRNLQDDDRRWYRMMGTFAIPCIVAVLGVAGLVTRRLGRRRRAKRLLDATA